VLGVADLGGGPLISGDHVAFATADGMHYFQSVGGGIIHHGDLIALRAGDSSWYVGADGGGGGSVNVNSASRGAWETFTILFVTPHSTEVPPATFFAKS
jgi:hypothetical protein